MAERILIDAPALRRVEWFRSARGRTYYRTIAPELGIIVMRDGARLDEVRGLVYDAQLGNERGVDGWCVPGMSGRKHGKASLFRPVEAEHTLTLSDVLDNWRSRYQ